MVNKIYEEKLETIRVLSKTR